MSNDTVTRPPALTPAERQRNRQERLKADVEAGQVARYQVESFRQLVTRAGALGITLEIPPGSLPFEGALAAFNEHSLHLVLAEEKRRREAMAAQAELPLSAPPAAIADLVAKERAMDKRDAGKSRATVAASKGRSRAVKTRKRVTA